MKHLIVCKFHRAQIILYKMKSYRDLLREEFMNLSMLQKPPSQGHPMS